MSFNVSKDGWFFIESIDEAGNFSKIVKKNFSFNKITEDQFYFAPNPVNVSNQNITLFYYLFEDSKYINISIFDISGNIVFNKRLGFHEVGENKLNIKMLASGIYYGILQTEKNRYSSKFSVIR